MNPQRHRFSSGLYAITPAGWSAKRLLLQVDALLTTPVAMLQYRDKPRLDRAVAEQLLVRCRAAGVPLIINDDVALARALKADGVHLGRDDGDVREARQQLGAQAIIGASCYADLQRAAQCVEAGADYLAFGSVFASTTKPLAPRCPLAHLEAARQWGRPIVAIGGITVDNAAQAIKAGADAVAVIGELFGDENDDHDVATVARALIAACNASPEAV
jgi:thiamine-phosphate pyrophosphorylase